MKLNFMTGAALALAFALVAARSAEKIHLGDLPEKPVKIDERKSKNEPELTPEKRKVLVGDISDEYYKKGTIAMDDGNLEQARADFERVLLLNPRHQGAKESLDEIALILKKKSFEKRSETSLPAPVRNSAAKPNAGAVKNRSHERAPVMAHRKEEQAAAADSNEAYREPDLIKQSDEYYRQALLRSQNGDNSKARMFCEKALEVNPKNLRAQRMLERLQARH